MPTPDQIVMSLQTMTSDYRVLAIIWHILIAGFLSILFFGSRPSRRVVGVLLTLPLFSVAVLGFVSENLLNGFIFAAAGIGLAVTALSWGKERVTIAGPGFVLLGAFIFAFGWVYPHFDVSPPQLAWLYASPIGIVPCATIGVTLGAAMMVHELGSRVYSAFLGVLGLFYGIYGVASLRVELDWGLILASAAFLIALYVRAPKALRPAHP